MRPRPNTASLIWHYPPPPPDAVGRHVCWSRIHGLDAAVVAADGGNSTARWQLPLRRTGIARLSASGPGVRPVQFLAAVLSRIADRNTAPSRFPALGSAGLFDPGRGPDRAGPSPVRFDFDPKQRFPNCLAPDRSFGECRGGRPGDDGRDAEEGSGPPDALAEGAWSGNRRPYTPTAPIVFAAAVVEADAHSKSLRRRRRRVAESEGRDPDDQPRHENAPGTVA